MKIVHEARGSGKTTKLLLKMKVLKKMLLVCLDDGRAKNIKLLLLRLTRHKFFTHEERISIEDRIATMREIEEDKFIHSKYRESECFMDDADAILQSRIRSKINTATFTEDKQ